MHSFRAILVQHHGWAEIYEKSWPPQTQTWTACVWGLWKEEQHFLFCCFFRCPFESGPVGPGRQYLGGEGAGAQIYFENKAGLRLLWIWVEVHLTCKFSPMLSMRFHTVPGWYYNPGQISALGCVSLTFPQQKWKCWVGLIEIKWNSSHEYLMF